MPNVVAHTSISSALGGRKRLIQAQPRKISKLVRPCLKMQYIKKKKKELEMQALGSISVLKKGLGFNSQY